MENVIFEKLGGIQKAEQFKEWACIARVTISQFTGKLCLHLSEICFITMDMMGVYLSEAKRNERFTSPQKRQQQANEPPSEHLLILPQSDGWSDSTMDLF